MKMNFYKTPWGDICYYTNEVKTDYTLVFLPGLTADHRLYEKQIEYFRDKYNILVWDGPGHYKSRPFGLFFSLLDVSNWLKEILDKEKISKVILIGQSFGGYICQYFRNKYPDIVSGFISIDSGPLSKDYYSTFDLYLLKHTRWMFDIFSYETLEKWIGNGSSTTEYGYFVMTNMLKSYTKKEYVDLVSFSYLMLSCAIDNTITDETMDNTILICGKNDHLGKVKTYNKRWVKAKNYPIYWIKKAGHNSNTDRSSEVNEIIDNFVKGLNE